MAERWSRRRFGTGLLTLAAVGGLGVGVGRAQSLDPEAARDGIQACLDRYAAARVAVDAAMMADVVDARNPDLLSFVTDDVRAWAVLAQQRRLAPATFTADRVREVRAGLVKARVTGTYGSVGSQPSYAVQGTWVFRPDGERWVLSEPLTSELGPRRQQPTEHFAVNFYDWDEALVADVAKLAEDAFARTSQKSGLSAWKLMPYNLQPNAETQQGVASGYVISYNRGDVLMRSPESYGFPLTAAGETDGLVRHEVEVGCGFHLFTSRQGNKPQKQWMRSGFALWVAETDIRRPTAAAVEDAMFGEDLIDWAEPRVGGRGYPRRETQVSLGVAVYAVRYIAEARGGMDRFWALVDRFGTTNNWARAVQETLGQTWPEFQSAFRAWLPGAVGL